MGVSKINSAYFIYITAKTVAIVAHVARPPAHFVSKLHVMW